MITFLKILKKIVFMLINLLFFVQIALMVLVFLTAAYWLFNLMGSSLFGFAEPIATAISDFVKLFYKQDVMLSGMSVDGSLLLFDFISVFVVFAIAKSKYYFYSFIDTIDYWIDKLKRMEEEKFNKALKQETDAKIRRANNFAVLVEFELKDLLIDKRYGSDVKYRDQKPVLEDVYKTLFELLQNNISVSVKRDGERLIVLSNDFYKVDNVLYFIEQTISRIRKNLANEKFRLIHYIAVDVYEKRTNFDEKILPALNILINLKSADQITCYGNFNIRYAINPEPMYYAVLLKGAYAIDGGTDIYTLLKKN